MRLLSLSESHRKINKAAQILLEWSGHDEEVKEKAFYTVADFRHAHAYPLRVVKSILATRAKSIDPSATIYGRSKRIISMIDKLGRNQTMDMTQMQDIAGCRAVMSDISRVESLL